MLRQHNAIPVLSECCRKCRPLPMDVQCFLPDVCNEMNRLICLHAVAFTKRRRLLRLAEPKYRKEFFVQKCPCRFEKPVEMIYLEDQPRMTRTEQLAYPPVRRLLEFKKRVAKLYPEHRIELLNRYIRGALLSMYSRLQNIQPPKPGEKKVKWTKKEWDKHTKYLKKLSKPKKPPVIPPMPKKQMPLASMKRFKSLAVPKYYEELEKEKWALTPGMKYYNPSENIKKMSQPKVRDDQHTQQLPVPITPGALHYKPTERIKKLAEPQDKRANQSDLKDNPFEISANALKAKASKRIIELAEPKEFENVHIRDNPQFISPAALKATASPRTIELAKPKGS